MIVVAILAIGTAVGIAGGPHALAVAFAVFLLGWIAKGFLGGDAGVPTFGSLVATLEIQARSGRVSPRLLEELTKIALPFGPRGVERACGPLRSLLLIDHPEVRAAARRIVEHWSFIAAESLYPLSGILAKIGADDLVERICPGRTVYRDLGGPGLSLRLAAICPPGQDERIDFGARRLADHGERMIRLIESHAQGAPPQEALLLADARRRSAPDFYVTRLGWHDPRATVPELPLTREEFIGLVKRELPAGARLLEWMPLLRPPRQPRYTGFFVRHDRAGDGSFVLDVFCKRPAWPPRLAAPTDVWDWYSFSGRELAEFVEVAATIEAWPDGPLRGRSLDSASPSARPVEWDQEFAAPDELRFCPRWHIDTDGLLLPVAVEWHPAKLEERPDGTTRGPEPSPRVIG